MREQVPTDADLDALLLAVRDAERGGCGSHQGCRDLIEKKRRDAARRWFGGRADRVTAPAGSEDAGLVLSAEDDLARRVTRMPGYDDWHETTDANFGVVSAYCPACQLAARIARTPTPAGDAQGSQEARNGPVSAEDAGDGRGHGRGDESGRGAGL